VRCADSADAALEACRNRKPDYIVLDLNMPGTSDWWCCRSCCELARSRLLVLTGYSSIATAVQATKAGACNYLCKPASIDEVLAALEEERDSAEADVAQQPTSLNRLEWEHLQRVLQENDGNISATARALGMHRRTLQRKLQKRPVRR
jgi:two-component system response regulator RegA